MDFSGLYYVVFLTSSLVWKFKKFIFDSFHHDSPVNLRFDLKLIATKGSLSVP